MKKKLLLAFILLFILFSIIRCYGGDKKHTENKAYNEKSETVNSSSITENNEAMHVDDLDNTSTDVDDNLFGDLSDIYDGETRVNESNKLLFEFNPQKYAEVLALPDDEMDYKYASDYRQYRNTIIIADSKAYTYDDLHKYIIDMYCKKNLKENMSSLEAEEVFERFMSEITWNMENLSAEYEESNPDLFRPEFEKCCYLFEIELDK